MGKPAIWERDPHECFYCGAPLSLESATIEHLIPLSAGGGNNDANLVLADKDCNLQAGSLPISEKIKLRESKRGISNKKITTLTIGDIRVEVKEQ
jgi:5-methylcytosine-specific restriction endonuclease McrA